MYYYYYYYSIIIQFLTGMINVSKYGKMMFGAGEVMLNTVKDSFNQSVQALHFLSSKYVTYSQTNKIVGFVIYVCLRQCF